MMNRLVTYDILRKEWLKHFICSLVGSLKILKNDPLVSMCAEISFLETSMVAASTYTYPKNQKVVVLHPQRTSTLDGNRTDSSQ
nr:hypothetical protein [Tanacetum cinerariifolium]